MEKEETAVVKKKGGHLQSDFCSCSGLPTRFALFAMTWLSPGSLPLDLTRRFQTLSYLASFGRPIRCVTSYVAREDGKLPRLADVGTRSHRKTSIWPRTWKIPVTFDGARGRWALAYGRVQSLSQKVEQQYYPCPTYRWIICERTLLVNKFVVWIIGVVTCPVCGSPTSFKPLHPSVWLPLIRPERLIKDIPYGTTPSREASWTLLFEGSG